MVELERGVAQHDAAPALQHLVRQHGEGVADLLQPLPGALVRDDDGAGVLERLAAGDAGAGCTFA
ncbi:MAG: hypothetical protein L6R19_25085 [Alphaproteobacteria bacterium]|nr:hypothetical protein [Alphaproteobacteria bacterium]